MVNLSDFVLNVDVIEDAGVTRREGENWVIFSLIYCKSLAITRSISHFRLGVDNGWF